MEPHQKINLIYIASTGRTGSTLLEMLLNAHPDIVTAGEIQIFPFEVQADTARQPCGCGQSVLECSFWQQVQQRANPLEQSQPQIHFFREQHGNGKLFRKQLFQLSQQPLSGAIAAQVQTYGANNYSLFQAFLDTIQERTGTRPKWVVDSSKDPYRLLWLVRSNLFNIKVIHSVRDPRSFVYSTAKHVLNNDQPNRLKLTRHSTVMSLSWLLRNHLISQISRTFLQPADYILVPYEKLALQPKATMEEVFSTIGCSFEQHVLENFWHVEAHTIAGNAMRFRKATIALDEKWRKILPGFYQNLTKTITTVGRARYGY